MTTLPSGVATAPTLAATFFLLFFGWELSVLVVLFSLTSRVGHEGDPDLVLLPLGLVLAAEPVAGEELDLERTKSIGFPQKNSHIIDFL